MSVAKFITIMQSHIGKANAISGKNLAAALALPERKMRDIKDLVIEEGVALCSHPSYGYWIAENVAEFELTCQFHHKRALHELGILAKLKRQSLPDLLGQLHLET